MYSDVNVNLVNVALNIKRKNKKTAVLDLQQKLNIFLITAKLSWA